MTFNATLEIIDNIAQISLSGELDASTALIFQEKIGAAAAQDINTLILMMKELEYLSSAGLRMLIFTKQKMGPGVAIYVVSPQEMVMDTLEKTGFHHSVNVIDEYDAAKIASALS
ncbi:anti-sigma factor antagonist [Pleurocapsales cyanobacterium LEGE 06147]|nr:anti-sigma factor antagonist [Pleurocapsales cyanobacterium LEGE 06147]